ADLFEDDLANSAGVCLPFGGLHDRSDQGAHGLHVAALNAVDNIRVGAHGFLYGCGQCAVVGDHCQGAGSDNFCWVTFAVGNVSDDLAGDLVVDCFGSDEFFDLHYIGRGYAQGFWGDSAFIGDARDFTHPPFAGGFGGGTGGNGLFDFVKYTGGYDVAEFGVRELPFFAQTAATLDRIFGQ